MPYCSRIGRFTVAPSKSHWIVAIFTPLNNGIVDFGTILRNTIGGARFTSEGFTPGIDNPRKLEFSIPREFIREKDLHRFLGILKWTVSISDDADESHALYLHILPHPTEDPYVPRWQRTRIGNLVNEAKSYGPTTGNKAAAMELSERMEYWIIRHPRYRSADVIISAPPGNPNKAFDLPRFIATHLSKALEFHLEACKIVHAVQQQKSLPQDIESLRSNVSGNFKIAVSLRGKDVIVIDDIYQSGETLRELTRACREAGAKSVLSLAASKTAKFCNGLPPDGWYEVSMEAEQADD